MIQIFLLSASALLALSYAAPSGSCTLNGLIVKDGDIFNLPGFSQCTKYKCLNGKPVVLQEGCEFEGKCIRVKGTLVKDCVTYSCSKSTESGINTFSTTITKIQCKDVNGICRRPGSTFKFTMNGRTYDKCTCAVIGNSSNYSCS
ncbi:hypothetical protein BgiMline_032802 [Biomphalaria glabrata]|uniref:Uncharacterized protein LOC106055653 n=1 Tax=Biomphalaria glabrata TaxID=6526 RepID=A0A2C9KKN8_BIOGL|nr:uncharacterized protein LOC106055653 [Biomphalaria glabrata]XP_055867921.1 uncharacterized protein LOC129923055 [Biomphalaria glabrata]KAI8751276.1 hypothetical protein BgiMline_015807 [Biomphalaria glabrata]KAI8772569.1 hypothetical protein BgiBS90_027049 [Biomphalaria glabrata]